MEEPGIEASDDGQADGGSVLEAMWINSSAKGEPAGRSRARARVQGQGEAAKAIAADESDSEAAKTLAADESDSEKGRVLDGGRVSVSCAAVTAAVLPNNGSSGVA